MMSREPSRAPVDVVCLGILVADAMGKPIDQVPEEDRLGLFERMELHVGGCAANTGIGLARLGARVRVVGKVGRDGFGDFVIRHLESEGIDADAVVQDPSVSTSFTFVMISSQGRRRFLHCPGANASFSGPDIDMRSVLEARILHIAGTYLMSTFDGEGTAEVLERAKAAGMITSMDTAYNDRIDDWWRLIEPCLPYLDYFLPSFEEAERITGSDDPVAMARLLKQHCPGVVGVKLGPEGFLLKTDGGEEILPPYSVEVADASGAGDAFVAGFLRGLLLEWPPERCARLGNAVASFCIRAVGCTTGVRSLEETLAFMDEAQ